MICYNCGNENQADANFCANCGAFLYNVETDVSYTPNELPVNNIENDIYSKKTESFKKFLICALVLSTFIIVAIVACVIIYNNIGKFNNSNNNVNGFENKQIYNEYIDNDEIPDIFEKYATQEDFEKLEMMLESCSFLEFADFDLNKLSTQDVLEYYITGGGVPFGTYTHFFGQTVQYDEGENVYSSSLAEDPEKRFAGGAYKLEADKVDWIVKNVFEKNPNRADASNQYYYKDEYLYISGELDGGPESKYKIIDHYLLEDGSYGFSVLEWFDIGEEDDPYQYASVNYYVCKLKEDVELGRYWSILKGSKDGRCFELPAGEDDEAEILFEYINALTSVRATYIKDNLSHFSTSKGEYTLYDLSKDKYTLYDINDDGIKELFVHLGTCEADAIYYVYTIENAKAVLCGTLAGSHSQLCLVNGELYRFNAHMGYWVENRIFFENSTVAEEITFEKYYSGNYEIREGECIEMSPNDSYTRLVKDILGF